MRLLERVSTLIRANLNDMMDRAEDPEKLIKQVILDMENQYLQVKTQVAVSIADQHMLEKKLRENVEAGSEWMRKAELAVDKTQDELGTRRARPLSDRAEARVELPRTGGRSDRAGGDTKKLADQARAEAHRSQVQARPADRPPPAEPRHGQGGSGSHGSRGSVEVRGVRSAGGSREPRRIAGERRSRTALRRRRRQTGAAGPGCGSRPAAHGLKVEARPFDVVAFTFWLAGVDRLVTRGHGRRERETNGAR